MSILDEVLLKEYERNERFKKEFQRRIDELPKGHLSRKKVNGKEYVYWRYRENNALISLRVSPEDVEVLQQKIEKRRFYEQGLREIADDQRKIKRAIGPLIKEVMK